MGSNPARRAITKMAINILSSDVVSKIAAGEVVERPASVVKELVENSLDAQATQITVEVTAGGTQLIRVIDNGTGIPEDEIEIAFNRHATSKITTEADIETITSLGFRGEALPTIASVAQVTMITRQFANSAGMSIQLDFGAITNKTREGSPPGTTVSVRNLFRNVPARLKFMKAISTENSHIAHLVTQYALAYPEVKFKLIMNGKIALQSPGNGNLRDTLVEVYGLEIAQSMLEIMSGGSVTGFISPPSVSRSNRNYLSFFVNRRWVQSRMLNYAVEEAYQGMLMTGKHPLVVLNVSISPKDIDVNVHPTKREIKFRNEREVFFAVQKAVRETLVGSSPVPGMRVAPSLSPSPVPVPLPFPKAERAMPTSPTAYQSDEPRFAEQFPILRVLGQFHNAFIIAEGADGLYLIDQHAAHERILFEKACRMQASADFEIQGLLEPVTIAVTAHQQALLESNPEALSEAGFSLEPFGNQSYLLRAVPAMLKQPDISGVLNDILDSLVDGQQSDWQQRIAASLACHGSVRAGQTLSHQEMEELVNQLEATNSPRTCPHGRPTMIQISAMQLEKEFGR